MSGAPHGSSERTVRFEMGSYDPEMRRMIMHVYRALQKKGYDPVSQLVGYLLSGDPTYITSYGGARSLIRSVERDRVLEELARAYLYDPLADPGRDRAAE